MGFEQLFGVPLALRGAATHEPKRYGLSCAGLVSLVLGHRLPALADWVWGRVYNRPQIQYYQARPGDLVVWIEFHPEGVVPRHVGIILNPTTNYVLHCGWRRGNPQDGTVHVFSPWIHDPSLIAGPFWPRVLLRGASL